MKQTIKSFRNVAALVCVLPLLCAWVDPVDLSEDSLGTGDNKSLLLKIDTVDTSFDRCDTPNESYTDNGLLIPSACHRWNLVWEPVNNAGSLEQQADWAPKLLDEDWRLPTIKELTRLINFGAATPDPLSSTLMESPTIKNWFTSDAYWTTNSVDIGANTATGKTIWLISSTYRDIDGSDPEVETTPGQAQVFAINIINGEIKTFEPGFKVVAGGEAPVNELRLCTALNSDGECDYGAVDENIIFALKVRTQPVSALISP